MAEAHPVGFQWVMEAKRRGATVIHVDPRFTRTSAVADIHVPIRAGTDIAFLGGLVNHVLRTTSTSASTSSPTPTPPTSSRGLRGHRGPRRPVLRLRRGDRAVRPHDLAVRRRPGSGRRRPARPRAAAARGRIAGASHERAARGGRSETPRLRRCPGAAARAERDETLQHPRCVYQMLKRHFARYTPEMVQEVCGIAPRAVAQVAEALTGNSGRERTSAFCYAVGWTHHSIGAQMIRTAAILQLLLGNIGRPGGGIMALRGHASIQGSTDIPTLFNILPGYMPMPHASQHQDLDAYVEGDDAGKAGFWGNMRSYVVSLLKAYWGDAATAENDFCFDYLPRLTGDHSTYTTVMAQIEGRTKGYFLVGENPAVGSANGKMQRLGLANLDWLVVRDLQMIESRDVLEGRPGDRDRRAGHRGDRDRDLLPARRHARREGGLVHPDPADAAVARQGGRPAGRLPQRAGLLLRAGAAHPREAQGLDRRDGPTAARPRVGLPQGRARRRGRPGGAARDQRHRCRRPGALGVHPAQGRRLDRVRLLDLLRGVRRRGQPGPAAQAALGAGLGGQRVGLGVAGQPAPALQPCLGRP